MKVVCWTCLTGLNSTGEINSLNYTTVVPTEGKYMQLTPRELLHAWLLPGNVVYSFTWMQAALPYFNRRLERNL